MQRPCRVRCRVPESITTPLLLASLTAIARIVLAAVGLCLLAIPAAAQSGPNVVMIILDDMNDWVERSAVIRKPRRPASMRSLRKAYCSGTHRPAHRCAIHPASVS